MGLLKAYGADGKITRYGKIKITPPRKVKPLYTMTSKDLLSHMEYKKIQSQIDAFKYLSPDYNGSANGKFRDDLILIAKQISESALAAGFETGEAFPQFDGAIRLTFKWGDIRHKYVIHSELQIELTIRNDEGIIFEKSIPLWEVGVHLSLKQN